MDQRAEQRVAIAKDALAWIKDGALEPTKGVYVRPRRYPLGYSADTQLRDVVLGHCEVCAKGALFLAKAVRYDNVLAKDWDNDVVPALKEHFDEGQLTLIECAFEKWEETAESVFGHKVAKKVRKFATSHPDSKDRLKAILKNIIKNDGTFVI